jgi:hypothetical protein
MKIILIKGLFFTGMVKVTYYNIYFAIEMQNALASFKKNNRKQPSTPLF